MSYVIHTATLAAAAALTAGVPETVFAQAPPRTLAAVLAHADDEAAVAPILARYAREGVTIHLIIASDGMQGFGSTANLSRPDTSARGDALVQQRAAEARCAATALGAQPPVLLDFPDGKIGDYAGDRTLVYRLTDRLARELARLRPDALITWGPDGGTGHPDHRLTSAVVTQLVRAGAPGVPERLFYMSLPIEGMRAMNPQRGAPPLLVPAGNDFSFRVAFAPEDLNAAERSAACHQSQFTPETVARVVSASAREWKGAIPLIPAFSSPGGTDVFK